MHVHGLNSGDGHGLLDGAAGRCARRRRTPCSRRRTAGHPAPRGAETAAPLREASLYDALAERPGLAVEEGLIYAVDPIVEASVQIVGRATPRQWGAAALVSPPGAERWQLSMAGTEDGRHRLGRAAQQVFSGGDGIIYAVDPLVEATLPTGIGPRMGGHPASGGTLWWYRHVGRAEGSFRWEGAKKVGTGWGSFEARVLRRRRHHLCRRSPCGGHLANRDRAGDGRPTRHRVAPCGGTAMWVARMAASGGRVRRRSAPGGAASSTCSPAATASSTQSIHGGGYAPTGIGPGMGGHPASGGTLWWYRHVGRADGSFTWEGPKKVGDGWGGLEHIFAGDGAIYIVDPIVEALFRWSGEPPRAAGPSLLVPT